MKSTGPIAGCQICSTKKLGLVLSLGHQPIVQEYLTEATLHGPEVTYPLNLVRCSRCELLQLDYIVEPKEVFPLNYPYRTGLTNMLIRNFQELAALLKEKGLFEEGDLVVDIGSNDGTLLEQFKTYGPRLLGIEPTNAAKVANKNGLQTIQDFFSPAVARTIRKKHGPARVITAANVFAHINNVPALMQGIKALMDTKSTFISESQYLMDIVEKLEFDTIYHEHLRFYSLKPLTFLFKMHGLSLVDAERISAAGGSVRVYAKKGVHPMSARAKKLIAAEVKAGLYSPEALVRFAAKVHTAKNDLTALLLDLKRKGAHLVGITSAARSNTLLRFANINETLLDYNGEKHGSPKIGMYTPGTHIPVVDEARILKDQPDYVVVLSWHIGQELMKKTRAAGYKGAFILPLPKAVVIKDI